MPVETYALEYGGKRRLSVVLNDNWKGGRVELDGQPLGIINGKKALKQGAAFQLPEGGVITVRRARTVFLNWDLDVALDERPLPESASDPRRRMRDACDILLAVSAIMCLFGLTMLPSTGGVTTAVEGALLGVLALLGRRGRMRAIELAACLYMLETVLILAVDFGAFMTGLPFRVAFVAVIIRGLLAVRAVRRMSPVRA